MTDERLDRPTVDGDVFLRYVERFTLAAIDRYTDVPTEREALRRNLSTGVEPIGDADWEALSDVADELIGEAAQDLEFSERPRSMWTTSIAQAVVEARLTQEEREAAMQVRIEELSAETGMPTISVAEWQGYVDRARDVDSAEARAIPDVQWDAVVDTPGAEFGFVSLGNPRGVDESALAKSIALAHDTRPGGAITFENENRRWDSVWLTRRDYVEAERHQRLQQLREAGVAVIPGSPQARFLTRDLRDPDPVVSRREVAERQARYGTPAASADPARHDGDARLERAAAERRPPEVDPSRMSPAVQQQQQQRTSLFRRMSRR
ncbi:hypothetical protein DOE76_15110 [Leifsonia sp. ku-ls]|nr:hypothetical protein DOE76_15110 [Leifsonia sp. ku-ls]